MFLQTVFGKMAELKKIVEDLVFFERFFTQNNFNVFVKWFLICVSHFEFLTQVEISLYTQQISSLEI